MRIAGDFLSTGLQVEERHRFSRLDLNFAFVILALNLIGLINLFSATHGMFSKDKMDLFWMQLVWLSVGWGVYLGITLIDYKIFVRLAYIFYGLNLAALIAVQIVGKSSLGATRWLDLGFFRYQPSETMKLVLVMVLAKTLANRNTNSGMGVFSLIWPMVLFFVPFVLTVKQPDLGTALVLAAISISM